MSDPSPAPIPLPPNLKPRLKASYDAIAPTYNAWTAKTAPARLAQLDKFLAHFLAAPSPPPGPDDDDGDDDDDPREARGADRTRGDEAAARHVLELGCGCGLPVSARLLEAATAPAVRLTANDLSSTQIGLARANLAAALGTSTSSAALDARVSFVEGDMMALSFPAGSLAGVLGFYSLIHLPRAEQAEMVRRAHAWLAPGGLFMANFSAEEMECSVMDRWLKHDDGWMFWSSYGAEGTVKVFEDVGFEVLSKEIKEDVVDASFLWVMARKKA
jgi:SAM-dependent methyltransferase